MKTRNTVWEKPQLERSSSQPVVERERERERERSILSVAVELLVLDLDSVISPGHS